jgi:hypothetical protein
MNPEIHALSNVRWQLFSTLTFKSLKVNDATKLKMFFALMRRQAANFGVHFRQILWVLRYELGESTGRPHFHALIAGLPDTAVQSSTCFSFMKIWESLGGGIARVRVFDSTLAGVEYILKGVDEALMNQGGNWYELNKFGSRCDVMLSMSLIHHMQNRSRFGHRDRDGLFSPRGRGWHARQRLKNAGDKLRGTDTLATTRQSGVRLFSEPTSV